MATALLTLTPADRAAIEAAIRRVFSGESDTEARTVAEAAHWRRGGSETLSGDAEVRRTVWIDCTAEVLADVRRQCHRWLPHHEAEELAAEWLTTELESGRDAGRPGCVRAGRVTPTYLRLTARDWLSSREASRLAELTFSDSDETLTEAAEQNEPDTDAPAGADVDSLYRTAVHIAKCLWIVPDAPVVYALAQSLADVPAAELAEQWGVSLSVWKRDAAAGAAEVRACYPGAAGLIRALSAVADHIGAIPRTVPLARRHIGAKLPDSGASHRRSAAQLDREADWLLAAPQLDSRTTSAKLSWPPRIVPAPAEWAQTRIDWAAPGMIGRAVRLPYRGAQDCRNYGADPTTVRGARPHRAAPGLAAGGMAPAREVTTAVGGSWRRVPLRGQRSRLTGDGRRPDWAHASRPIIATSSVRARHSSPRMATAPTVPAEVLAAEQDGFQPISRKDWRALLAAPAHMRPGLLRRRTRSLDTATAEELAREQTEAFPMVEDMIAAAAE